MAAPGETEEELRKKFGELPLGKKIATLLQFEVITVSEAFDAAIEKPLAFGSKAFDSISNRARKARTQTAEEEVTNERAKRHRSVGDRDLDAIAVCRLPEKRSAAETARDHIHHDTSKLNCRTRRRCFQWRTCNGPRAQTDRLWTTSA